MPFITGAASNASGGGAFGFTLGATLYACWYSNGADVGTRQSFTAPLSGSVSPFLTVPNTAGTYTIRAYDALTGGNLVGESGSVTVSAPPAGAITLTGLPSSIAAGQPLSGVTFAVNNSAYGDLVLYDQTASSQETTALIATTVTPDTTLDFLVPQIAGHTYNVRLVDTSSGNDLWDGASFTVTAAPGALPAAVGGLATSNATTTQLTVSWTAVSGATGYKLLARSGYGTKYGSLLNTATTNTSVTFTGLSANQTIYLIIAANNANGQGPSVLYFATSAAS